MDFDQNDNISTSPPSQGPQTPPQPPIPPVVQYASMPPAPKRRSGWKVFFGIVLTMSILANIALFVMLIGMAAFFAVSPRGFLAEETIREAPAGGRVMGRNEAKKQLSLADEQAKMSGIVHGLRSVDGLDEAPGAYKNIDEVMENQKDLTKILVKLTPLGVIKGD